MVKKCQISANFWNVATPSRQEMMQFDILFSRKWSKNAKFQPISENEETPSRQEMKKQLDNIF